MSVTAAELIAKVSVSGVSEATSQLKSMGESTNKTGGFLKGMVGNMLSMAGGIGIANLAANAFSFVKDQLGSVFEESMNAQAGMALTNAVLKSTHGISGMTGQAVADLAGNLSHVTTFSDDTTQAAENMLLTFTNIGKNVFPQATKTVLDMSQALGQDTKNSAIQLGKALNDPIAGVSALQRVGVTFSGSQKDLIKHFMDTNNIAGAQGVILKELQKEFGGAAEAAGKTLPGQLKILGQRFDDVKQSLGDALMPMLTKLVSWVSSSVVPALARFSDWFIKTGIPALQQFGAWFGANILPTLQRFGSFIMTNVIPALQQFGLWFGANILPILQRFGSFIVTSVIPALQQFGGFLSGTVWPILKQIGAFLSSTFAPVWQQLVTVWQGQILPALKQLWAALQPLMPVLQAIGGIILAVVVVALGLLVGVIAGVIKGLAGFLSGLATVIGGIVKIFTGIVQVISGIVRFLYDLLTGNFGALKGDLATIWAGIVNIFSGAWDVIKGIFQAAWGAISGLVSGFVQGIIGFFTNLWHTLVGGSIIPDMINGIIRWFASLPGRVFSFVSSLVIGVVNFFLALAQQVIARAGSLVSGVVNFFAQLPGRVGGWIASMADRVLGGLAGLAGQALSAGANIVRNIASGILGSIGSAIGNAMSAVGSFIHDHLPHSPAKLGPLKDLEYQGSQIVAQISKGMRGSLPDLQASLQVGLGPLTSPQALSASGYSFRPVSGGQPVINVYVASPDINMDGWRLTDRLMPHLANKIRYGAGGFGR